MQSLTFVKKRILLLFFTFDRINTGGIYTINIQLNKTSLSEVILIQSTTIL